MKLQAPSVLAIASLLGGCALIYQYDGYHLAEGGSAGATATGTATGSGGATTTSSTTGSGGATTTSSASGGGGSATTTTSGTTTTGSSTCPAGVPSCKLLSDCAAPTNECEEAACVGDCCGRTNALPGKSIAQQTSGDCKKVVCDGNGGTVTVDDDTDVPASSDACHVGVCSAGTPTQSLQPAGTSCNSMGGWACDGYGACKAANGIACGGDVTCASGHCVPVDPSNANGGSVCCNTACDTPCSLCGAGTCGTALAQYADPRCVGHGAGGLACASLGACACDSGGLCKLVSGSYCATNSDCASNVCVPQGGGNPMCQ